MWRPGGSKIYIPSLLELSYHEKPRKEREKPSTGSHTWSVSKQRSLVRAGEKFSSVQLFRNSDRSTRHGPPSTTSYGCTRRNKKGEAVYNIRVAVTMNLPIRDTPRNNRSNIHDPRASAIKKIDSTDRSLSTSRCLKLLWQASSCRSSRWNEPN
jgi:hypothetical protein